MNEMGVGETIFSLVILYFRFEKATEIYDDMIAKEPSNSVRNRAVTRALIGGGRVYVYIRRAEHEYMNTPPPPVKALVTAPVRTKEQITGSNTCMYLAFLLQLSSNVLSCFADTVQKKDQHFNWPKQNSRCCQVFDRLPKKVAKIVRFRYINSVKVMNIFFRKVV